LKKSLWISKRYAADFRRLFLELLKMEGMSKVVLIIDKASGAWSKYLQGIADYARLNGPWVFFASPPFYLQNHAGKIEFIDSLGCTVHDVITKIRIEEILRVVIGTIWRYQKLELSRCR
jgi:hypothetical protein